MTQPGWTAVVVNYNGAAFLEPCLRALQATRPAPSEIVVVDNASSDDSLQELHAFPRVNVLAQPRNLGFAGGANAGLAVTETSVALLMNPDVEVDPTIGAALIAAFAAAPVLGAAGALLRYPDGQTIQHAGGVIERPLLTTRHHGYGRPLAEAPAAPVDVDFVTGGAMGLRLASVAEIGGFDEAFTPVYYEDVDLCVRLRAAGWEVRLIPSLTAIHHEGVTLAHSDAYYRRVHENRVRFALKHLTGQEWRTSFVPAEHQRLRHALATLADDGWPEQSGAAGLEGLLRGLAPYEGWDDARLLVAPPPAILERRVAAARDLAALATDPARRRRGLLGFLRDIYNAVENRGQNAALLAQQRHFNAAVVHALEAQESLNREQTALTLLLALDTLGRLEAIARGRAAPPAEQ